jgi:hypothetical protein
MSYKSNLTSKMIGSIVASKYYNKLLLIKTTKNKNVSLTSLYEAWNKPEKAEKWRAKLSKTEAKTE